MIKPIFGNCSAASVLAHVVGHCVSGLTLPLDDANYFFLFIDYLGWFQDIEEGKIDVGIEQTR